MAGYMRDGSCIFLVDNEMTWTEGETVMTKLEVFREMKKERYEAERADSYGMHSVIINSHIREANRYSQLLDEMEIVGVDTSESLELMGMSKYPVRSSTHADDQEDIEHWYHHPLLYVFGMGAIMLMVIAIFCPR